MVSVRDYTGREQSYVKHVFLESYLERLVHKTASVYRHVVYIDGFAGPWQSANEKFEDTSFGIALNALNRAKQSWAKMGREVAMSAFLVERDPQAYEKLVRVPLRFPEIAVETYNADFTNVLDKILERIPSQSFRFFLIDPKGWRIRLRELQPLLSTDHSEVVFNFMFDFINRAASIRDDTIRVGLDELIPFGNWRAKLEQAEQLGECTPEVRKRILADAFGVSLKELGKYEYVAETTVLRPLRDRPLYCLFYATRHPKGIEVFRDCQVAALKEESKTRALSKVRHAAATTGQGEFFQSVHDMAPDELASFLREEEASAEDALLDLSPLPPRYETYERLRAQVLSLRVIRPSELNKIAARLQREGRLIFPDWEAGKRVPQRHYRTQRTK